MPRKKIEPDAFAGLLPPAKGSASPPGPRIDDFGDTPEDLPPDADVLGKSDTGPPIQDDTPREPIRVEPSSPLPRSPAMQQSAEPGWSVREPSPPDQGLGPVSTGHPTSYSTGAPVQPLTVPLWPRHGNFPATCRLIVFRQEPDFRTVEIGALPKDATIAALLAKWPVAGTYLLQPVNDSGQGLERDLIRKDIPADHEALRGVAQVPGAPRAGGGGTSDPEIVGLLREQLAQTNRRMAYLEDALAKREQAIAAEREQYSKERLALAAENTGSVVMMQERLIDRWGAKEAATEAKTAKVIEAAQNAQVSAMDRTQVVLTQFLTEQAKAREDALALERDRMRNEMERERAALERERAKLDADLKKQEAALKAEAARQEALAAEREKLRDEAFTRETARQREHEKAMQEVRQQQANPLAAITGLIREVIPHATTLAPLIGPIANALTGNEPEPQGLLGQGIGLVKSFLDLQRTQAAARAGMPPEDEDEVDGSYPPGLPGQPQGQLTGPVGLPPQAPPQLPPGGIQSPAPVQQQVPAAGIPQVDPQAMAQARVAALPLDVQRAGRKVVRTFVDAIRRLPQGADQATVVAAIFPVLASAPEGTLEGYLMAATVAGACREAGADPALVEKIIQVMDANGIGPGIPRR